MYVFMWSARYSCQILMNMNFLYRFSEKYAKIKFDQNPFNGTKVVLCGRTVGQTDNDETNRLFRNFAKTPSKRLRSIFIYIFVFSWPCIIIYQYSETNAMHILFSLLRINGLYMFQILVQPTDITRTQYTKCRLCGASWGWESSAWHM
jgi:hypothetical protein